MAKGNVIWARDCLSFDVCDSSGKIFKRDWEKVLFPFSESFFSENSVFHFLSNKRDKEDDMPFAQRLCDTTDGKWKWFAGRWVGSANTGACTIKVLPRFGNLSLFALLEEIFFRRRHQIPVHLSCHHSPLEENTDPHGSQDH